jgi:hypothetical protein
VAAWPKSSKGDYLISVRKQEHPLSFGRFIREVIAKNNEVP